MYAGTESNPLPWPTIAAVTLTHSETHDDPSIHLSIHPSNISVSSPTDTQFLFLKFSWSKAQPNYPKFNHLFFPFFSPQFCLTATTRRTTCSSSFFSLLLLSCRCRCGGRGRNCSTATAHWSSSTGIISHNLIPTTSLFFFFFVLLVIFALFLILTL